MQENFFIMNRIFHARVPWYTLFLLILLTFITVWAYWERVGLVAAITLLLMIAIIERAIHTTYTITTENTLIIKRGRFAQQITIPISEINRIERLRSAKLVSFYLKSYLLISYGNQKSISLIPTKEEELVECIRKHRKG